LSKYSTQCKKVAVSINVIAAIFLLLPFSLSCQNNNKHSGQIDLFKKIDSLSQVGKYNEAITNCNLLMQQYYGEDWSIWYEGFTKFRKIRSKQRKLSTLITEIKSIYNEKSIEDQFIKSKVVFFLAFYYGQLGAIDQAIKYYKITLQELDICSESIDAVQRFSLLTYQNLSINYSRLGDQKSAIKYANLGIKNMNLENPLFCEFHLNKSLFLLYNNEPYNAEKVAQKALEVSKNKRDSAYAYLYLAQTSLKRQNFKSTGDYLDKCLILKKNQNSQYYEFKGDYYIALDQLDRAKSQFEIALKILKKSSSTRVYNKVLTKYASVLFDLGQNENTVLETQKILYTYDSKLDTLNKMARPNFLNNLPDVWAVEALYLKAKFFRDQYIQTKDTLALGEAMFYYDYLTAYFDRLKNTYYSSSSKYRMGAYSQKIYSEIITFYVDLYKLERKSEYLESAFSLAQRANSYVLRNAVSDRDALELAGVSQDSLEQYLFLLTEVSSESSSEDTASGAEVLLEFDAYKASLLSNYPSYGKYDQEQEISIDQTQAALPANAVLIKYYYFDDIVTVFGITHNSVFAENIEFGSDMDSLIDSNLDIITTNQDEPHLEKQYLENAKTVYDTVLGNLLKKHDLTDIDQLIVVPDGPLKKVAFNALPHQKSLDWNDPNAFLLSKYRINYLYYCNQLKNKKQNSGSKNGFIGFGIQYNDNFLQEIIQDFTSDYKESDQSRTLSLSPLKYADEEAAISAQLLDGTSYLNEAVTPENVISNLHKYDVIHFSAHALVDQEDYLNSFVLLNKDKKEQYKLKYEDILNLEVDSELVVLSACQTSTGKNVVGEGLMSLSRAFVQSGSEATVGAYWNAPDYATKELMRLFYTNLKAGMPKSKAMQQAQIEYLTNDQVSSPTIRSPFYWASWTVYGNDDPLSIATGSFSGTWLLYGFLVLVGIGAIVGFLRFKGRKPA